VKYLLDTNACIAHLNGRSEKLTQRLRRCTPESVVLCAVVKAELLFGARKSAKAEENLARLTRFFQPLVSLPFDDAAADRYGSIRATLERAGTPIGANDLMIGAIALTHSVTVVTANEAEFSRIDVLVCENWEA
jgi:tRNA(fMet)-specific endonuclease VapC